MTSGVADQDSGVRLAELVAALSLATDLGLGQPAEHVVCSCLVAVRLGEELGMDAQQRQVVFYVALLASVGCHADSFEHAKLFGDDIAARASAYRHDLAGVGMARYLLGQVGAGRPPLHRARDLAVFALTRGAILKGTNHTACLVAGEFARRLELDDDVYHALQHCFERWDGRGWPEGIGGEDLALPARIFQLADVAVAWHRLGGIQAATEVARARRGTEFDPALVDLLQRRAESILADVDQEGHLDAVLAAEPSLSHTLSEARLDVALQALGDFSDLKSPYFSAHSRNVSRSAERAAIELGLPQDAVTRLRRAGLVADLGRIGVSNAIWDTPQPLNSTAWERIRTHPYLTERILAQSPALSELAGLAALHHERLDGSGYPRGLTGQALSPEARLLGAADCYQALLEPRPHRPAMTTEEAENALRSEVKEGRIDGEAADAVLVGSGARVRRRREWPGGLTAREVEVLRLLSRGASNREIAERLGIRLRTAGSHVEHIYAKTGANSRAAATLYAMRHGLLEEMSNTSGD